MRQRLLLVFAFLLTLAASCKKEDDDLSIPYVPPYRVSGVVDFSIQKYSFGAEPYEMYVQVEYENGEQERVTLALEGVPDGLEDSLTITSGYPSFYTVASFVDSGIAEGTYNVKLVATGATSGRREYPFTIRVLGVPDCAAQLVGSYNTTTTCSGSGSAHIMTIEKSPTVVNKIFLSNLNNAGTQLYAEVTCGGSGGGSNSYFSIPSQSVNGATYSGYGYYSTNPSQPTINMYVTRSNFGSCNYYLTR